MFKKTLITFLLIFSIPINALAYSDRIIASGENIGITLNTDGVLIAGTYNVGNNSPANEAGLKSGDLITKVNGKKISKIDELASEIDKSNSDKVEINYTRDKKNHKTTLNLIKDEDVLKTGLYVKDSVTGIGTLTFIDPETKLFGALGHEITNTVTGKILEIKDGKIFDSKVTGIVPSQDGTAGEKKAQTDSKEIRGEVSENTTQGIFGKYSDTIDNTKTYKVASKNEIKKGNAKILTVLNGNSVSEYNIEITEINDENSKTKNFVFKIIDDNLLKKTGGIVQGMSGSPIVQGDYIIGAVTHVVVDDPEKGYGIFITNMLEEAEN